MTKPSTYVTVIRTLFGIVLSADPSSTSTGDLPVRTRTRHSGTPPGHPSTFCGQGS